jgi:hypothetical protein
LGYWTGVLGTAMVLLGLLGVAYGWTTVAVGDHLHDLANQLHENRVGIAMGGMINAFSIGLLNLSGVETAHHARQLIDLMPSPGFLHVVGWIRVGLSGTAVVIGVFLVLRRGWALWAGAIWSVVASVWFIWATWQAWGLLTESFGDPTEGVNTPFYVVDLVLHLLWPLVLAILLVRACARRHRRSVGASP